MLQTQQVTLKNIYLYASKYMHAITMNNMNEQATNLKENWEGFVERKGEEET